MKPSFNRLKHVQVHNLIMLTLVILTVLSIGCKKFLDQKPNKADVIPEKLNDLQTLLDNSFQVMNTKTASGLAELLADNYYVTSEDWGAFAASPSIMAKNQAYNYVWDGQTIALEDAWNFPYQNPIYYSNIVLDQLSQMKDAAENKDSYNNLRGSALFYRSFAFLGLAQLYCKPYDPANANATGIVLRLTSNVSAKSSLSTLQQTYDQIINDLKEAISLLPEKSIILTRPSKTAAYAALARTYLFMRDYNNSGNYAKMALEKQNTLMDYNDLIPVGSPPIKTFNPEVIFHNTAVTPFLLNGITAKIDSSLIKTYDDKDLRKQLFFVANTDFYNFQGSYDGNFDPSNSVNIFDGLATDEMFLIRAECNARIGNWHDAMDTLNYLLSKRWTKGSFKPLTASSARDALNKILIERRKELVFRGLRWPDIRRFNLEGANISLKRIINGTEYVLPPNDLRYVMLFPLLEILLSGIPQNPR